jgi:hypothetical protein
MGFDKAAPYLADITRSVQIGTALVRALPVREMVITRQRWCARTRWRCCVTTRPASAARR